LGGTGIKSLVLDFSQLFMSAFFAGDKYLKYTTSYGTSISGCYIFLKTLFNYLDTFHPHRVFIVTDTGKSVYRRKLYRDYKKGRSAFSTETQRREWQRQRKIIYDCLRVSPFHFVSSTDVEADSIISFIVRVMSKVGSVTIVSRDKDFYQLKAFGVEIFDPVSKTFLQREDIAKAYGFDSVEFQYEQLPLLIAIMGDKDEVPGIKSLGPKFCSILIEKVLKNHPQLRSPKEFLDVLSSMEWGKWQKKVDLILDRKDQFEVNYKLCNLLEDDPTLVPSLLYNYILEEKKFDMDVFVDVVRQYELEVVIREDILINFLNKWKVELKQSSYPELYRKAKRILEDLRRE